MNEFKDGCYIIGDIHGNYKTLLALIEQLPKDPEGYLLEPLIFAGDLIDRGPSSKEVIEYAIENGVYCIKGNHEQMLLDHNDLKEQTCSDYLEPQNGGKATLDGYVEPCLVEKEDGSVVADYRFNKVKFNEHIKWIRKLPLYLEFPDFQKDEKRLIVAHSNGLGLVYNWTPEQIKADRNKYKNTILWDRGIPQEIENAIVVCGHTPVSEVNLNSNYIDIDTGCFLKDNPEFGKLTALHFPSMKLYTQRNID